MRIDCARGSLSDRVDGCSSSEAATNASRKHAGSASNWMANVKRIISAVLKSTNNRIKANWQT
jgi:hypothetical protein